VGAVWEPKEEKKAFAFFLKAPRELHSLRACGREFHKAAPPPPSIKEPLPPIVGGFPQNQ